MTALIIGALLLQAPKVSLDINRLVRLEAEQDMAFVRISEDGIAGFWPSQAGMDALAMLPLDPLLKPPAGAWTADLKDWVVLSMGELRSSARKVQVGTWFQIESYTDKHRITRRRLPQYPFVVGANPGILRADSPYDVTVWFHTDIQDAREQVPTRFGIARLSLDKPLEANELIYLSPGTYFQEKTKGTVISWAVADRAARNVLVEVERNKIRSFQLVGVGKIVKSLAAIPNNWSASGPWRPQLYDGAASIAVADNGTDLQVLFLKKKSKATIPAPRNRKKLGQVRLAQISRSKLIVSFYEFDNPKSDDTAQYGRGDRSLLYLLTLNPPAWKLVGEYRLYGASLSGKVLLIGEHPPSDWRKSFTQWLIWPNSSVTSN